VVAQLAEVLLAHAVERGPVQLGGAADEVVHLRLEEGLVVTGERAAACPGPDDDEVITFGHADLLSTNGRAQAAGYRMPHLTVLLARALAGLALAGAGVLAKTAPG
jgi:hypothetical protein